MNLEQIKREMEKIRLLAQRRQAADWFEHSSNYSPEIIEAIKRFQNKNSKIRGSNGNAFSFMIHNQQHRFPSRPIKPKFRHLFPNKLDRDRMTDEQWRRVCGELAKQRYMIKLERWAKL